MTKKTRKPASGNLFSAPRSLFLPFLLLPFLALPAFTQTMSLDETLSTLNSIGAGTAELRWDPFFASGTLSVGRHEASFSSGSPGETGRVILNHRDVLTLPLPYPERGAIRFPQGFVNQIQTTFTRYAGEARSEFRVAAIIIDAGHGGRDPGAIGTHTIQGRTLRSVEKNITLAVALQVHNRLAAAFPDKQVLLTRRNDSYPTLEERVNLANSISMAEHEAAIYISIHANSSFNKNARGYEVWYLSPGYRREVIDTSRYADIGEVIPILNTMMEETLTRESILLANNILSHLDEAVGNLKPSRGLKAEEWFVVRNARMPSVLVEVGFVSNQTDALLMDDEAHLKKLADALYKGISDFIAFFEQG